MIKLLKIIFNWYIKDKKQLIYQCNKKIAWRTLPLCQLEHYKRENYDLKQKVYELENKKHIEVKLIK